MRLQISKAAMPKPGPFEPRTEDEQTAAFIEEIQASNPEEIVIREPGEDEETTEEGPGIIAAFPFLLSSFYDNKRHPRRSVSSFCCIWISSRKGGGTEEKSKERRRRRANEKEEFIVGTCTCPFSKQASKGREKIKL